jgi:uncharacterized protein YyaL (SSP411 family)
MERESFEDADTAALMNRLFVNIKVDREERPDLDSIYMSFVQLTTGGGGWPLTVFLTPTQAPFFGGTYFPPRGAHGRPSFREVLFAVERAFRERRADIEAGRAPVIAGLAPTRIRGGGQGEVLSEDRLKDAASRLTALSDPRHGGFGAAPKFPNAMALAFLLRSCQRSGSVADLGVVERSLQAMARGGIYDHLGGGFHRYAVDDAWLVPHFEKMLYDNALLARVYLEAYQATGNPLYRRVVEETLGYVARDMRSPSGGFFSSQDADSDGEEGRFYLWSLEELRDALGAAQAARFADCYDVSSSGNFEGRNILHLREDVGSYAAQQGTDVRTLQEGLDASRRTLFEVRVRRVPPARDDKILCAWNGLMLGAFAQAASVLGRRDFLEIARQNAAFLINEMFVEGRLHRSWSKGQARWNAYLEDYASVIEGLISLFQAAGEAKWLAHASELMDLQLRLFWDEASGDCYFTSFDHEPLLVRPKESLDNAVPSGNSVTAFNLLRLAVLKEDDEYRCRARSMLERMAEQMLRHPLGMGYWLQAVDFYVGPVDKITVAGSEAGREPLLLAIQARFLPRKVLVTSPPADASVSESRPTGAREAVHRQTTAHVCRDGTCFPPATTAAELTSLLASLGG